MKRTKNKTLVIGLGEIGYHNAEYITKKGLHTDGYDINKKATLRALQNGVIQREANSFKGYDQYIISISTHNPENINSPSLEGVFSIAERISREGDREALVSIESTITKGVSREIFKILNQELHVTHTPHRFFLNQKNIHGVRQKRVLGGCKPCCSEIGAFFYRDLLDIPLHIVNSIEIAELSKIVENSHRFLEIAFAEELKMLCDMQEIDFEDLRKAVNSKWNVKLLEARQGIKGHCLPKDTQMYLNLISQHFSTSILTSAKNADAKYKQHFKKKEAIKLIFSPSHLIEPLQIKQ